MALQYRDKVTGKVKYLDESKDPNIIIENLNNQLTQANADLMLIKLEQAQANAEIIELMMSMLGGA